MKRVSLIHYRERDKRAFAPAVCGARGGRMYWVKEEITCTECLLIIQKDEGCPLRTQEVL